MLSVAVVFALGVVHASDDCEFAVNVGGSNKGLNLTALAGMEIVMAEESPNEAYFIKFTPCANDVSESCYSQKAMAAQLFGASDAVGNGILAMWDNKATQPKYTKTAEGADAFTFEYPQMGVTCNNGCYNGRQQEITFICDATADPYDKAQSKFYETPKTNGICYYHLDLYTKYACPVSLGPTKTPTPAPTSNASCDGDCVGPVIIKEGGVPYTRFVMGDSSNVEIDGQNKIMLKHGAQVQIAQNGSSQYGPYIFKEYKLMGKTLSYMVDLSDIGCSCNSAFYLVTMPGYGSNGQPTPGQYNDFYCDANDVGGVWCWEFDIQEANQYVTATTPHSCDQGPGGFISNCDRGGCGTNSHNVNGNALCPGGNCIIDTLNPFKYSITFGSSISVVLQQGSQTFSYTACDNGGYVSNMRQALDYGMVMVMSYWGNSYQTMQWLDGMTGCGGDCAGDGYASFWDIEVS